VDYVPRNSSAGGQFLYARPDKCPNFETDCDFEYNIVWQKLLSLKGLVFDTPMSHDHVAK
jgi:hypothetical protein